MLLFGVLLILWAFLGAYLVGVVYILGGSWLDFAYALDPRDLHITGWWFWFCLIILTPVAILAGLVLAYVGRWRAALLVIPALAVIDAAGGVAVYLIDRLFI